MEQYRKQYLTGFRTPGLWKELLHIFPPALKLQQCYVGEGEVIKETDPVYLPGDLKGHWHDAIARNLQHPDNLQLSATEARTVPTSQFMTSKARLGTNAHPRCGSSEANTVTLKKGG